MNLNWTEEQEKIINTEGDLIISALAGSGKTSTLLGYAAARPNKKIMFLAFNKSIADEATHKFKTSNINNVVCKTTHSLAYRGMSCGSQYKVGYNPNPYFLGKDYFNVDSSNRVNYKILLHAINYFEAFCNSDKEKIEDVNYLALLAMDDSKAFYIQTKKKVDKYAKQIWEYMETGKMPVSHSWYLKAYQLTKPQLNCDIVMIDEGQDLAPVQLDIFLNQNCQKVIVGDSHQSIYAWRGAIDALEKVKFPKLYLTNSFRFSEDIAQIALEILRTKEIVNPDYPVDSIKLSGKGKKYDLLEPNNEMVRAYISRNNYSILMELIAKYERLDGLYVEGELESLLLLQGSNIHLTKDVLNLYIGDKSSIKNGFIKTFKDIYELEEYANDMDDGGLVKYCKLVKQFGTRLNFIINDIKKKIVPKEEAKYVYSTIHKSKGQEYDYVEVISDYEIFPPPVKHTDERGREYTRDEIEQQRKRIIEEINIMYVGVTRAKKLVRHSIPDISSQRQIRELVGV